MFKPKLTEDKAPAHDVKPCMFSFETDWQLMRALIIPYVFVLLSIRTATLGTIPCWYQDKTQYYAVSRDSYVPIAELDHLRFFSLAEDMAKNKAGSIEIRKPTSKDITVSCKNLSVAGNRPNQRLIRRLIRNLHKLPYIHSITSFWPEVRVCASISLSGADAFPHELEGVVSECTHIMVLSDGKLNQKHALFVSDLETLKGKRKLIEVFYQNFLKFLNSPKDDYRIQIVEARALPDRVIDVFNHLKLQHPQKKLNVAFLLDMYLTSGLAEHTFHFGVFPGNGLIDMLYYQESLPSKWAKFVKPFMFGLLAAAEPYLNMDFAEAFDIREAMLQAHKEEDSFYLILPKSEKEVIENDTLVIISILDDPNRERLLYSYLSLASGPFHNYIRALEVVKVDDGKIVLSFILKANPIGILNFFGRLSTVLIAAKSVHLSFPPKYLSGFKQSLQENATLVATAYREKMTFNAYRYKCGFGEDSGLSPFEVLIKYGMVKCPLSDEGGNGLDNKDRIALGLQVIDMSGYSYLRSKKHRRTAPNTKQKDLQVESFESTSSSDDEDIEKEDLIGKDLVETFKLHARLATQAKVSNALIQRKLDAIKRQCQSCDKLILEQRKLIIYELFLRIKGLLAPHVIEPSSVLGQLKKPKSPLRKKLEATKIPGIIGAVQKALEVLENERLAIAKPLYKGEPLYWITSTEFQNAFFNLLRAYQVETFTVPVEDTLPLFGLDSVADPVTMDDVLAIKEQREEAEETLHHSQKEYAMIKNESQKCLLAYKNREILIVGAVFKAFVDDLKAVARDGDIIREAYEESSPVRVKMDEAGIQSVSLLRKIYTFVLTHRNVVAHPPVQPLPDDEISRQIEPSMKNIFVQLHQSFETLEKHFTQGEALEGRFD